MLYQLIITDTELSDDAHREDFLIGVFRSREDAAEIAAAYLTRVPGFCDYPCSYEITEKAVRGQHPGPLDAVWRAVGWNTDENLNETDVIESALFAAQAQANAALEQLQAQHCRSEWAVQRLTVGQAEWAEGFVREAD